MEPFWFHSPLKTLVGSADKEEPFGTTYGGNMGTKKQKTGFWIDGEVIQHMDALLEEAHVNSRSEFAQKAIEFYISFLQTKRVEKYLLPTFSAAISGVIGGTEERIARLLYTLALEIAMLDRIVAFEKEIPESVLLRIKEASEQDIRENTGYWKRPE